MANYSVSADQLTEGTFVLIRGILSYARLTSLIDGPELQAADARRTQNGKTPINRPHTTATITQAVVVPKNPASLTLEEQFVAERRYISKKYPETGLNYSIDSKGQTLPVIAIPSGTPGQVVQDYSGKELASGLDVTLVMRVYKPNGYNQRGLSLDQVLVNEPVRYYSSPITDELAARGITFAAPPQPVTGQQGAANDQFSQPAAAPPVGTVIDNGFPLPAPAGVPAQQAQPVPAPTVQPAATAQPQPLASAAAPAASAAQQAQPVPAPTVQPAATAQPQPLASAAAPAASAAPQEEPVEAKLARLLAENEALRSASSAASAPAASTDPRNPWGGSPAARQPGITPGR